MADKYYVGQGSIWIASRTNAGQTSGFTKVGDADALSIKTAQSFLDLQESQSGNRATVIHAVQSTDFSFDMSVLNIDGANLARAFYGSNTIKAGATVTAEAIVAYNGSMVPLAYPNVSAVVVHKGATPLVLNTDYTVDAVNGTITILPGSTLVLVSEPLTVDYTYGACNVVEGNTTTAKDFVIRFEGINTADNSNAVLVTLHRVALDMSSTMDLLGTTINKLTFSGKLLPDATKGAGVSSYFKIVQK